jgi:hypothetical protein
MMMNTRTYVIDRQRIMENPFKVETTKLISYYCVIMQEMLYIVCFNLLLVPIRNRIGCSCRIDTHDVWWWLVGAQ